MILHAKPRLGLLAHSFDGYIEEVEPDLKAVLPQPPQNIVLHPIIVSDDGEVSRRERNVPDRSRRSPCAMSQRELAALLVVRVPQKSVLMGNFLYIIHTRQPGPFSR